MLVILAVLAAVGWRLLLFHAGYTPDSDRAIGQADALLNGEGFVFDGAPCTGLPPGYPLFLASVRTFSTSLAVIRTVQFFISVAACLLVFAAIQPVNRRLSLIALYGMALHPILAWHCGRILSETFATFLAALTVWLVSRCVRGAGLSHFAALGILLVYLPLTTPGLLILTAAVFVAMLWTTRLSKWRTAALVTGVLIPLIPWQLHCMSVTGRLQPMLLTVDAEKMSSGFALWTRTWVLHEHDLYVWWDDGETIAGLPESTFRTPGERHEMIDVWRRNKTASEPNSTITIGYQKFDATFRQAAEAYQLYHPLRYYVGLPIARAFFLWSDMPQLEHFDAGYISHISLSEFWATASELGLQTALLRAGKAVASLIVYLVLLSFPAYFVVLLIRGGRMVQPLSIAIVLGVVAYTAASSIYALGEVRRNLPLLPFLFFLSLFVGCRPSRYLVASNSESKDQMDRGASSRESPEAMQDT